MFFWPEGVIIGIDYYGRILCDINDSVKVCIYETFQDFLSRANSYVDEFVERNDEGSVLEMKNNFRDECGISRKFPMWREIEDTPVDDIATLIKNYNTCTMIEIANYGCYGTIKKMLKMVYAIKEENNHDYYCKYKEVMSALQSWFTITNDIESAPLKCQIDIMTYIGKRAGCEGELHEMPIEKLYRACLREAMNPIVNGEIVDSDVDYDVTKVEGIAIDETRFEYKNYEYKYLI